MRYYSAIVNVEGKEITCPVVAWHRDHYVVILHDGRFQDAGKVDANYKIVLDPPYRRPDPPRHDPRPNNRPLAGRFQR